MVGREFIKDNLEKRGFAAAVRTDNTHTLTFVDTERDIRQNVLVAVMD
jgi:hypothetical protein